MDQITVLDQNNAPLGPFTRAEVAAKIERGEISLDNLAFIPGLSEWTPLRSVLAQIDAANPQAVAPAPASAPVAYSYAATMQPPSHLVYADFWPRVAAHIIDNLIIAVPVIGLWMVILFGVIGTGALIVPQTHNGKVDPAMMSAWISTILLLYVSIIVGRVVIAWLYHAFLESGPHQSTFGKRAMGLKVTSITGQRIGFAHASGRYFGTFVTNMTMLIGYLMVLFTERKQTLHDMMAGTLVVRG